MMRSLYSGVTGLNANKKYMETIGDNIANVNTPGFKSSTPSFANVLNQTTNIVTSNVNSGFSGNEIGNGVAVVGLRFDWTQGPLQSTGNATDLSINGGGFFGVSDGTEMFYTRAGDFSFDKDGNLITLSGMNVQGFDLLNGNNPPIAGTDDPQDIYIDLTQWESISVDNNGTFYGIESANPDNGPQALWQVSLYEFANINGLGKMSDNLWRQTADSGDAVVGVPGDGDYGNVISSTLEISNVDLATEFVNMITAQRAFQANSRVITTSDEMLAELINIKR